ncbi:uncharacterized protein LOC143287239 [Babylonia areolata]|uniref:uncharacterized protein LOC143287239 n=1 Tax=Babylonia areolata TaxID=304850 RepID=UPI003FD18C75
MTVEGGTDDVVTSCTPHSGQTSMLTMTSECDVTLQEMISSLIGLTAGPIWLVGHFLILSVRQRISQSTGLPAWVTCSLIPHCVADVISCAGAMLAFQLFPQIVFALMMSCVHIGVLVVIVLRHLFCNTREDDLHGNPLLVNSGCATTTTTTTVSLCSGGCPLKFCPRLSLLMIVTLASADVTATDLLAARASSDDSEPPWREITGEVLGTTACLGHWMVSLYEALCMYRERQQQQQQQQQQKQQQRRRRRCQAEGRREWVGVVLMMVSNAQYLLTVLWRPRLTGLTGLISLPWTACRAGLLVINLGMLLQLWRTTPLADDKADPANGEADESLLSTSCTGSDVDSQSYVLWDTRWKEKQRGQESIPTTVTKFVTLSYPVMPCVGQGRSAATGFRRPAVYDLLQSTDSSCSRTAGPDTEVELGDPLPHDCAPVTLHADTPLSRLSPLTPEARQDRVWRWVEKSSSPDDDSHVMELAAAHAAPYRQHSGSFSHQRCSSSVPNSRKNSAIF